MTQRYFMITLLSMGSGLGAGLYLYAYSLAGSTGRAVLSGGLSVLLPELRGDLAALFHRGRHAGTPGEHVGVTEETPLLKHSAAFLPEPPTLHTPSGSLDHEALAIIAAFDDHVAAWRTAPDYVLDFQQRVSAGYRQVGISTEPLNRWRAAAWDMSTGSYPVLDRELATA